MELITKLGIEWKLLVAQIINFGIIAFVLYKFVYHPVLNMLDKRSKMIEKGIEDAKKSEELLKNIEKMREEKMGETERKVGELLTQAKNDAEGIKKKILEETQLKADDVLRRAQIQIAEEKEKMFEEVKAGAIEFSIQLASKILEKGFSEESQKKLTEAILREMKTTKTL